MSPTVFRLLQVLLASVTVSPGAWAAPGDDPPRLQVRVAETAKPLVFVAYGDTRFTRREEVANSLARRSLVEHIAREHPAAILIGGDLVFQGSDPEDYEAYRTETAPWAEQHLAVFPALGNHELRGCEDDLSPCLENWWNALGQWSPRPYRWYSVSIGPAVLALVLDSNSSLKAGSEQREWFERQVTSADPQIRFIVIVMHYPPVSDPFVPRAKDEKEVARYLSRHAKKLHARVVVVGSHLHNYERYNKDSVTYLVSGGGGAKPAPSVRLFGEQSHLHAAVNFHYLRFVLADGQLSGTMVRFDPSPREGSVWTEPDHFEVRAKD
jgi:hypothetical protein